MTTFWDLDGLETKLREVADCLRGVPIANEGVCDIHRKALALKRGLELWRKELPPDKMLSEVSVVISDLLDKAKAVRGGWRT